MLHRAARLFGALFGAMVGTLLACGGAAAQQPPSFAWPKGVPLAVSLGYDDALPSQLDHALSMLDALGLKASFYLTLSHDTVLRRLPEWRAAAARGHELGNHTIFHPCSRSTAGDRGWVAPHRDLDRISVAAQRDEILAANAFLHAIDGRTERTFTAPCGDLLAAGEPYLPAVRAAFVASKTRAGGVTPDVAAADPHGIGIHAPVGAEGEALVALVEQAARDSGGRALVSITFHGVGGDHLAVSREAHERLLRHLAAHPERYLVDTFVNIMRHARAASGLPR
jgi:peptidoglycan/xylan/chitin deacetylase (PgdA/CDA1 family)